MTAPHPTAAFEVFYRAEHGRLLRYFRKQVGRDEAPDLVQETFTRLLRSGVFDRVENPTAYLMRSARNLLIERARRKMREQCIALPYDDERDAPVHAEQAWRIEEADVRRIYRRTLRAMPRRTRRIFLMHRLKGMTYREIAEQIGISDKGVQHHMMRALARCRRAASSQW
ncbi:sigma-70 family RNA polymerase sigma factor [Pelagerythrobacter aerophilus]|uniref:Sigma-70 family RNA polymerase sigma factor n=1 Tax=Pelagerythrobacter aerophilus TaxID=2306995 RepID=A0A418NIU7_9SPHN|nr:sigma-70 family RNA polymerase sigma factor [Pelagerythrobacter aerophilus]RIV78772.1 sigma-70 family RNA polymerase sigma factor [Pelagerythrobacter aerophilus]